MEKIDKKQIREDLFNTEKKRVKTVWTHAPFYRTDSKGKKLMVTTVLPLLNGKSEADLILEIQRIFKEAAEEFNIDRSVLTISCTREYSTIDFIREETDEEFKERIEQMIKIKIENIRKERARKERQEKTNAKRIAELEAELKNLKNI